MKKNLFYTLAALFCMAAAFVSCTSSDEINTPIEPETPTTRTITVNLIPEGETRTMLDANAALRWQTGDEVSYFTSSNGTDWSNSTKATIDASTGKFSATIPAGATHIRVGYPAVADGTAYDESLFEVKKSQTIGTEEMAYISAIFEADETASFFHGKYLPMETAAIEVTPGETEINAPYSVKGAVIKFKLTLPEGKFTEPCIKSVSAGQYKFDLTVIDEGIEGMPYQEGHCSYNDKAFCVVVPLGTVDYTPSVEVVDYSVGSNEALTLAGRYIYTRKETKTSTFTAKAYELDLDLATKYDCYTKFKDNGDGTGTLNGHAWVDLGQKTSDNKRLVFATTNIGAKKPEDAGLYFWWGDIVGHAVGADGKTTPEFDFNSTSASSYGNNTDYVGTDNILKPEKDAATQLWGGGWRMGTSTDFNALLSYRSSTESTINSVTGYEYKSSTNDDLKIFIPKVGDVEGTVRKNTHLYLYWTSTNENEYKAKRFGGTEINGECWRYNGYPIRPVAVIP